MTSIRHFPATHPLPDWRNLGVALRLLLGVNLLAGLAALLLAADPGGWLERFVELAALVEPLLLAGLALLAAGRDLLWRLPLRAGQAVVLLGAAALAGAVAAWPGAWAADSAPSALRHALLAAATAGLVLAYFELRARSLPAALGEARLAALNARIRPHFLFNSLNAALSLIRARPQEAEAALEALADLFRAALRDPGELSSLAAEIALGRQYLELEQLRLGDRLAVVWEVGEVAPDLPIPPLMLQPLLENAVYHGIEPAPAGGCVRIAIARHGDELHLAIANPLPPGGSSAAGKQMALANIRERLALYYDVEARLEIAATATDYEVRIVLPWRPQTTR